jgi:uncharacterized membrane protein HdeD (DUF308 family)
VIGEKKMRIFVSILAVLLILVGAVWFLQGINVIGGSIMTGQAQWEYIGGFAFLVGIILLIFANRKRTDKQDPINK